MLNGLMIAAWLLGIVQCACFACGFVIDCLAVGLSMLYLVGVCLDLFVCCFDVG